MASETTYSCDCCGELIEERDPDNKPQEIGESHIGNMAEVKVHSYNVKDGELYTASWQDFNESWELCIDCARRVKKAINLALRQ